MKSIEESDSEEEWFNKKDIFCFSIEEDYSRPEVSNSYQFNIVQTFHRKHKIEVSNGWDVFKIINFISYIPLGFSSTIKRTTVDNFNKLITIEENGKIIFEIYLTNGLDKQQLFLRNYTKWIKYKSNHYYVPKVEWSLEKPDVHPLVQFGRHFGRHDSSPCQLLISAFKGVFKRPRSSSDYNSSNLGDEERLDQLIEGLPGYVEFVKQRSVEGGFKLSEDYVLQRITWVCSWCAERLKSTQYIQLDTSFKATDPYCYCCVNAIINNESVTVAITIGMSESCALYESTYLAIEQFVQRNFLNRIPVLSDMGKGLISFCFNRGIQHFFCHRHILERFGHKILRNWAQRLLECTSEEQYSLLSIQIALEIEIWCSQQADPKLVPDKIGDIQSMLDPNSDSLYNVRRWAIWLRIPLHMARCSNHSEALHHVMNMECKCLRNFITRLTKVFKVIIRRFTNQHESHGRSLRSRYRKLRAIVDKKEALSETDRKNHSLQHCTCGWNSYYTSLYGVQFPCIHEIRNERFSKCPEIPGLDVLIYPPGNKIVKILSDSMQILAKRKDKGNHEMINISRNIQENERHQIRIQTKGENTKKSLIAFWNVVKEMKSMYNIPDMNCVDIAMFSFYEWGLMEEETATAKNIAHFRIQCWNEAEKFCRK